MAKDKQKELTPQEVIDFLQARADRCQWCNLQKVDHRKDNVATCSDFEPGLCSVGRARLRWWKKYGIRFKTVKEALKTWTPKQFHDWAEFIDLELSPKGERLLEAIDSANSSYCKYATKEQIADLLDHDLVLMVLPEE